MRENRLYGSMRGGARTQRKLAIAAGSIPHALARLLYFGSGNGQTRFAATKRYPDGVVGWILKEMV